MISIIIPVYNSAKYLDECFESITKQTFSEFEVLCVDDGSTDDSLEKCRKWETIDRRFHVFTQKNQGVSCARNLAIEQAKGEYICFIDSDDVVAPDYLLHLTELAKDGSFPVCGYTRKKEELGRNVPGVTCYDATNYILHIIYESIAHPNIWMMLFKADIIREHNIRYVVGCVRNEDTEFFVNYLTYEKNVIVSKVKNYYYRPNPTSAMLAPITAKALTSIEAAERMNKLLVEKGIIVDPNIVKSNSVLIYSYSLAKRKNKELYNLLHIRYDVRSAMTKMLSFPRISKNLVAISYLFFGKRLFYKCVGLLYLLNR